MKIWKLIPYESVGPICFTDTVDDIIKKLGEPEKFYDNKECLSQRLIFADYFIDISQNTQKCCYVVPGDPEKYEIMYQEINLNTLDYKKIVKELYHKGHTIYGDFSSFPIYVDKDIGVSFVTHESDIDDVMELDGLEIFSNECFPKLCPDDVLITSENQII